MKVYYAIGHKGCVSGRFVVFAEDAEQVEKILRDEDYYLECCFVLDPEDKAFLIDTY